MNYRSNYIYILYTLWLMVGDAAVLAGENSQSAKMFSSFTVSLLPKFYDTTNIYLISSNLTDLLDGFKQCFILRSIF